MPRIQNIGSFESIPAGSWPIEGVLSGFSLLWGDPGIGKSFVAISMAASVASGRPWVGRRTHEGRVVYVAGEGGGEAVARRLRTALQQWTVDPSEEPVPLEIVTPGLNLTAGPEELIGLIGSNVPKLVIVDTLNRCFVGDENKPEQMTAFVRTVDTLRDIYGCTVLVVHHANKEGLLRGSSVLAGAVDTSWRLSGSGGRGPEPTAPGERTLLLTASKLRERNVNGATIPLRMMPVVSRDSDGVVERNEFGAAQTSLVVKPPAGLLQTVSQVQAVGLRIVAAKGRVEYDEWRTALPNTSQTAFENALSLIITYPGDYGIVQSEEEPWVYTTTTTGG